MHANSGMPKDFPKRIHQALKSWHKPHAQAVLDDLLLARQIRSLRGPTNSRLVANEILINGLDRLRTTDTYASDLLQRRFPNQETARAIAHRSNMTEDVVYQHQRAAILQLARIIWVRECDLRRSQMLQLVENLESPTYTQLVDRDSLLTEIQAQIESSDAPWIVSVEGMGGIGKSAFADALARRVACGIRFCTILWISTGQHDLCLNYTSAYVYDETRSTWADLLGQLTTQLGLSDLEHLSESEQCASIKAYLKSHPCLIVIDNLETVADYWTLIPHLRELAMPSKFVITTRYSLQGESGVYIHKLKALSLPGTLDLVRQEAAVQGLLDLASASDAVLEPVYSATGGNPLATELIVGQAHIFPLHRVLKGLADGDGEAVRKLLLFIHGGALEELDVQSQRMLADMAHVGAGEESLDRIVSISGVDTDSAITCLRSLAMRSLIRVSGDVNRKRYALHPLTRAFIIGQCSSRSFRGGKQNHSRTIAA